MDTSEGEGIDHMRKFARTAQVVIDFVIAVTVICCLFRILGLVHHEVAWHGWNNDITYPLSRFVAS